jgi:hypothetical protein
MSMLLRSCASMTTLANSAAEKKTAERRLRTRGFEVFDGVLVE